MAEAPRYPDLENKNVTEQLNELKDYSIKLQRFVANALQTIDERNMTSTITSKINGAVTFTDLATEGSTTINGSNITTGSINALNITGCNISSIYSESDDYWLSINDGYMRFYDESSEYIDDAVATLYSRTGLFNITQGERITSISVDFNHIYIGSGDCIIDLQGTVRVNGQPI